MADNRPNDLGYVAEITFEPGKSYVVFIDAYVLDGDVIKSLCQINESDPVDYVVTYVLCNPSLTPMSDAIKCIEVKEGSVIFVQDGVLPDGVEIPGLTIKCVKGSPHWALGEYRRAQAGWVPDHIPMIPIRGGHQRWNEETDREYFERIVESVTDTARERAASIAESEFMNHPRYGHVSATPEDRNFCANIAQRIRNQK